MRIVRTALVFLVVVPKLEYFLNSKIIGQRIRNPVWLTLIPLVIGERLMGIPGLVLAPVVLNLSAGGNDGKSKCRRSNNSLHASCARFWLNSKLGKRDY